MLAFMQNTRYDCQIIIKFEFSRHIFEKSYKFHETPSGGSRAFPCGRTGMTKLTVAFRSSTNGPKKHEVKRR